MRTFDFRRRVLFLAVILAVAVFLPGNPALGGQSATTGPEAYIVVRNVMVPMRDGVRLATDLYFPARNGAIETGSDDVHP